MSVLIYNAAMNLGVVLIFDNIGLCKGVTTGRVMVVVVGMGWFAQVLVEACWNESLMRQSKDFIGFRESARSLFAAVILN